ncbi:MAG TPA: STAS domain-containing protein [Acidimicrobiales bacterium]|nr:STAS domain-containing protein [Acidimicrobiales bacterium]
MTFVENPFRSSSSRTLSTVVVAIRGELDTYTAPQLQSQLRDLVDDQGNRSVVLEATALSKVFALHPAGEAPG